MSRYVIAGDVGGTHTRLAVYRVDAESCRQVRYAEYSSSEISAFEPLLAEFSADGEGIAAAAIGAAGPVLEQRVQITNLPWGIDAASASATLSGAPVRLLNDLEALAYGTLRLGRDDLVSINAGVVRNAHRVVIAAGTGLGQALLYWNGKVYQPSGSEGGHADFGPRSELEVRLFEFLLRQFPRVTWERALSGPGLHNLFRFAFEELGLPVADEVSRRLAAGDDPGAVVGEAALSGSCAACVRAVEMFVSIYGAQAGNFALSALALGGVYIGGGIALHLLPKLTDGTFWEAFRRKQPFVEMMSEIPVHLITNPHVNLLGAAHVAAS